MTEAPPPGPSYFEDGHTVSFLWDKDEITIGAVHCPHKGSVALCNRGRHSCVVDTYLTVYGTACNIGKTWIDGPIEVAWFPVPGESEFDREFAQIWIAPVNDESFQLVKDLDRSFEMEAATKDEVEDEVVEPPAEEVWGDPEPEE